jgi:hypothetical protein
VSRTCKKAIKTAAGKALPPPDRKSTSGHTPEKAKPEDAAEPERGRETHVPNSATAEKPQPNSGITTEKVDADAKVSLAPDPAKAKLTISRKKPRVSSIAPAAKEPPTAVVMDSWLAYLKSVNGAGLTEHELKTIEWAWDTFTQMGAECQRILGESE